MSTCSKCGKKLQEDALYCSYCGTPTGETPPFEQVTTAEPETSSGEAQPPEQAPTVEAPKPSRSRRITLVLIILIAIAAGIVVVYKLRPLTFTPQPTQIVMGADWSGYTVSSSLKNPQAIVTGVSGSWVVPSLTVTPGSSYSASWIGIGGQFDQTLIQTGTEHDVSNGQAKYSAWFELLPDTPVYLTMGVSPGDTMTASIKLQDAATNMWLISLRDVTNGESYQKSVRYYSSMLSAEWIVERPIILGSRVSLLSDFGSVTFTNCNAIIGSKTGNILEFPSSDFIMNNRQNNPLISVSVPSTDGSSFTVTFESAS